MHSITLNQIWKKKLGLPWTLDPTSERSGPSKKIKYGVRLYNRREFLYYLVQISLGGYSGPLGLAPRMECGWVEI